MTSATLNHNIITFYYYVTYTRPDKPAHLRPRNRLAGLPAPPQSVNYMPVNYETGFCLPVYA